MSIFNKGYNISDMYDAFGTKVGDKSTPFIADTAFAPKYTRTPESRANLKAGLEKSFYGGGPEDPPITPSGVRLPPRRLPQGRVQFTPFDKPAPKYRFNQGDASQLADNLFSGVGEIWRNRDKPGYFANRKVPSYFKPVTNALANVFPNAVPAADTTLKMLQSGLMSSLGLASKATGLGGDLTADALYRLGILDLNTAQKFGERLGVAPFAAGEAYGGQLGGINALSAKALRSGYKAKDFVDGKKPLTLREFREKYPDYRSSTTLKTPEGSVFQTVDYPNLLSASELKKVTDAQRMVDSLRINPLLPPSEINARIKARFKNVTVDNETMKAGIAKPIPKDKVDELDFLTSELDLIPSKSSAPYIEIQELVSRQKELVKTATIRERFRLNTDKEVDELTDIYIKLEELNEAVDDADAIYKFDNNLPQDRGYKSEFSRKKDVNVQNFLSKNQSKTIEKAFPKTKMALDVSRSEELQKAMESVGKRIEKQMAEVERLKKANFVVDSSGNIVPNPSKALTATQKADLKLAEAELARLEDLQLPSSQFASPLSRAKVSVEAGRPRSEAGSFLPGGSITLNERRYAGKIEALNNRLRNKEITRKTYNKQLQEAFEEMNNTVIHEAGHSTSFDTQAFALGEGSNLASDTVKKIYGTFGPRADLMRSRSNVYLGTPKTLTGVKKTKDPIEERLLERLTTEYYKAVDNLDDVPPPQIYGSSSEYLGYFNQGGEKFARGLGETPKIIQKNLNREKKSAIETIETNIKSLENNEKPDFDMGYLSVKEAISLLKKEKKRLKETDLQSENSDFSRALNFKRRTTTNNKSRPLIEEALDFHRRNPGMDINKVVEEVLYGDPFPGSLNPFAYVSP